MPDRWMAPELLQFNCMNDTELMRSACFGLKSDVWSFGVVMWEIATGCKNPPYSDWLTTSDLRTKLYEGYRLSIPAQTPSAMLVSRKTSIDNRLFRRELMTKCWSLAPTERPDFNECMDRIATVFQTVDGVKVRKTYS
jgi:hypothetical protein